MKNSYLTANRYKEFLLIAYALIGEFPFLQSQHRLQQAFGKYVTMQLRNNRYIFRTKDKTKVV